jgi:acetyltransferase
MPVNPNHRAIEGVLTYPDADALPEVPDLAVIATPPTVPGLIAELGARGTKAVVVITAGFGEGTDEARRKPAAGHARCGAAAPCASSAPTASASWFPEVGLNASFATSRRSTAISRSSRSPERS